LHHTISSPALPYRPARLDSLFNDSPGHTLSGTASPIPGFGGTGSTTVNTKLKDHVFATILKRLKKKGFHHRHHQSHMRPDDDADDEGDRERSRDPSSRRRGRDQESASTSLANGEDVDSDLRAYDDEGRVRRTRSEVLLSPPFSASRGSSQSRRRRNKRDESADRGLFAMEDEDEASLQTSTLPPETPGITYPPPPPSSRMPSSLQPLQVLHPTKSTSNPVPISGSNNSTTASTTRAWASPIRLDWYYTPLACYFCYG
jgi:hypothetical protein